MVSTPAASNVASAWCPEIGMWQQRTSETTIRYLALCSHIDHVDLGWCEFLKSTDRLCNCVCGVAVMDRRHHCAFEAFLRLLLVLAGFLAPVPHDQAFAHGGSQPGYRSNSEDDYEGGDDPQAVIGLLTVPTVGESVILDGSGSINASKSLVSYSWSIVTAPVGSHPVFDSTMKVRPSLALDQLGS